MKTVIKFDSLISNIYTAVFSNKEGKRTFTSISEGYECKDTEEAIRYTDWQDFVDAFSGEIRLYDENGQRLALIQQKPNEYRTVVI